GLCIQLSDTDVAALCRNRVPRNVRLLVGVLLRSQGKRNRGGRESGQDLAPAGPGTPMASIHSSIPSTGNANLVEPRYHGASAMGNESGLSPHFGYDRHIV